jgi:hypothetical protein
VRRILPLVAVVAIGLAAPVADAKQTPVNHVYGSTIVDFPGETVSDTFDVSGPALTTSASGLFRRHIVADGLDIDVTGAINCLNVVGNTAYLSGSVVASNREDIPIGAPFYTVVVDVSPDGTGDMVGPVYFTGLTCADVQPAEFTITTGNVVVEQCGMITAEGECTTKG